MEQQTAMQATPARTPLTDKMSRENSSLINLDAGTVACAPWYLSAFTSRLHPLLPRAKFWPVRALKAVSLVARDADQMIRQWGEAAYEKAALMSSQEDAGLIPSSSPGHWWRVQNEIGSRLGRHDDGRKADFVPR